MSYLRLRHVGHATTLYKMGYLRNEKEGKITDKGFGKIIFSAVALAMGVATLVLSIIKQIEAKTAIVLLSIGLICLAVDKLENR